MIRLSLSLALAAAVSVSPLDPWFDSNMTAQMLGQIPLLLLLGLVAQGGLKLPELGLSWALAWLILCLGLVGFWMIPRSLDLAVSWSLVDLAMHGCLWLAGLILGWALKNLGMMIRLAAGIYALSMWGSFALVLLQSASRVCARFSLEQQQAAGSAMLWAGGFLLLAFITVAIRGLVRLGPTPQRLDPSQRKHG